MKTKMAVMVTIPALLLACAGYSQDSKPKGDVGDRAIVVDAIHAVSKVTAVDAAKRTVSVVNAAGLTNTYKLGKEVRNFDQIKVGDSVKATLIESVAVGVRKSGVPPSAGEGGVIALSPKGDKPGVVMAETKELTAKILVLDTKTRTVTLQGPRGGQWMFKAGPNANLDEVKEGDEVTLRVTEALALRVEKP